MSIEKKNDWAKLLAIAEFVYNNTKNTSTSHTSFEFNYSYYPKVLFEENINFCLRYCFVEKLARKLRKPIEICYQNLFHIQELQKKAHNKRIKSSSYTLGKKI